MNEHAIEPAALLDQACNELRDALGSDRASLFLFDEEKQTLYTIKADKLEGSLEIPIHKGIASTAFITKKALIINDVPNNPLVLSITDYRVENLLAFPIVRADGKCIAVVELLNRPHGFDGESITVAEKACKKIESKLKALMDQYGI